MKKNLALSALLLGVVFLSGCGQQPTSQIQPATPPSPTIAQPAQPVTNQKDQAEQNNVQQNQVRTPVNMAVHSHDTSKWLTYTNTKYGYSFKYPNTGWQLYGSIGYGADSVSTTTADELKTDDQVNIKTKCSSDHSQSIDVNPQDNGYGGLSGESSSKANYKEAPVTFLGVDADQATYSYISGSGGKKDSDEKEVSFTKNGYNYTIGGTEIDYLKDCGDSGIIDDILSTFKFTK